MAHVSVPFERVDAVVDLSALPDAPWVYDVLERLVDAALVRSEPDGLRVPTALRTLLTR